MNKGDFFQFDRISSFLVNGSLLRFPPHVRLPTISLSVITVTCQQRRQVHTRTLQAMIQTTKNTPVARHRIHTNLKGKVELFLSDT